MERRTRNIVQQVWCLHCLLATDQIESPYPYVFLQDPAEVILENRIRITPEQCRICPPKEGRNYERKEGRKGGSKEGRKI